MTEPAPSSDEQQPDADAPEMILSEEELLITTELVQTGRVRLLKRIEIETVTRTVELRREVLEIERLDTQDTERDGNASPQDSTEETNQSGSLTPGSFREGVAEILLMQEEAVVTTRMVPRERVRLTKHVVTETRVVDADLQVERVDLEQRPDSPNPVDADHSS